MLRLQLISLYIYIYIHLTPVHEQDVRQGYFSAEFNRLEFRVFLFFDGLSFQGKWTQSALLIVFSYMENSWIHTFSEGIGVISNANSRFQYWNWVTVSIFYTITLRPYFGVLFVCCFFVFYGILTVVGYLMPNSFLYK